METAKCKRCNIVRPIERFGFSNSYYNGRKLRYLRSTCKTCFCKMAMESRYNRYSKDFIRTHSKYLTNKFKQVSKGKNLPFDLTFDFIYNLLSKQKQCECCKQIFDYNLRVNQANKEREKVLSIDRFIPSLGYTQKNIALLCWRCNNIKRDSTSTELRLIADWIDSRQIITEPQ